MTHHVFVTYAKPGPRVRSGDAEDPGTAPSGMCGRRIMFETFVGARPHS